jgi:TatD DNase family protein
MLVDSHCHLNYPDFKDDFTDVLRRAKAEGVELLQTICTKMEEFETLHALTQAHPQLVCSVGVHPHYAGEGEMVTCEALHAALARPKVIGLGETGLDYFYEHSPREAQKESFARHIRVAQDTGVPLIVHTRDAEEDTVAMLEKAYAEKPFKGLIHCFSSSRWLGEACVAMGMSISLSGILTFKKAEELREAVRHLPLENLLVETDAPYLAPDLYRGKRNEPAFVRRTAIVLAEIKGISLEECAAVTTDNFYRLFTRAKRPHAEKLHG